MEACRQRCPKGSKGPMKMLKPGCYPYLGTGEKRKPWPNGEEHPKPKRVCRSTSEVVHTNVQHRFGNKAQTNRCQGAEKKVRKESVKETQAAATPGRTEVGTYKVLREKKERLGELQVWERMKQSFVSDRARTQTLVNFLLEAARSNEFPWLWMRRAPPSQAPFVF